METYLSDTFNNAVLEQDELFGRYLERTPEFQQKKVPYSEILKEAASVRESVKQQLLDVVWHNLPKVSKMYESTFDVAFPSYGEIAQAISTRHDIVHRNGKRKDGSPVAVARVRRCY